MTLFIVSVALALGVSGLCSLLEATLLSYSPSQVAALSVKQPRLGAVWQRFKDNIERPIAVILIVNTAAHTIGATIAGAQFESVLGAQWLFAFSIVFTYFMLQFTEILPKTLGVRYNDALAPLIAPPLALLVRTMSPVLTFIHLVNRPFSRGKAAEESTLDQIAALAASAWLSRSIDPQHARMIRAASEIENIRVRQVLTPRTEVTYLRTDTEIDEMLRIIEDTPYTRLPLCEGDLDHPIGIVNVKDIFKRLRLVGGQYEVRRLSGDDSAVSGYFVIGSGAIDLMEIKREALYMPEHISILDALRRFQRARMHLALIVDEHGVTQGIVTLEDVIEEVVGDTLDEFDVAPTRQIRKEGDGFRVQGRFPLHEIKHYIPELGIGEAELDADTVGGFATQKFGRIPRTGARFTHCGYVWKVTSADDRRVREVLIVPVADTDQKKPPK